MFRLGVKTCPKIPCNLIIVSYNVNTERDFALLQENIFYTYGDVPSFSEISDFEKNGFTTCKSNPFFSKDIQ